MRIKFRQGLFRIEFLLVFCFSGLLSTISIIGGKFSYRSGITVSLLAILIVLFYGLRINKVTFAFIALTIIIILSGLYNKSTPQQVMNFLRNVIFSFLVYNSVQVCIRIENIKRIIKWCVLVAVIQLPIILFQQAIYPQLPASVHAQIEAIDIGSGTFNIYGDAAMGFFLVLMIIFLLFNPKRNYFIRNKWFILPWLTLTIFVAQAELLKLVVLSVWAVYFLVKFRSKKLFYALVVMVIVFGSLAAFGLIDHTIDNLTSRVRGSLETSQEATERFLAGDYTRGAAISYYLKRGVLLLGDGPSKYYEIQTRQKLVGNFGHFLTFYSEVGLLGWFCSVLIFFLIAFPIKNNRIRFSMNAFLNFISLMLITLTSFLMDDTAVVMAFCIMSMVSLIPEEKVASSLFEKTMNNYKLNSISQGES